MSIIYRALKKLQSDRESGETGAAAQALEGSQETTSDSGSRPGNRRALILLAVTGSVLLLTLAALKLVEIAASGDTAEPPPRPKRSVTVVPVAATKPPVTPQPPQRENLRPTPASQPAATIVVSSESEAEPESGDSPSETSSGNTTAAIPVSVLPAAAADPTPPPASAAVEVKSEPAEAPPSSPPTANPVALESGGEIEDGGQVPPESYAPEPLIIDESLPNDPATDQEYGKYQRSSKKQANTALAAARLQQAIRSNDSVGVNRALEELARLKGRNSAYFLQMQAYWYLNSGQYSAAERVLNQVLHMNPNSLHGGLNMAVLESLTGREESARNRLNDLARRFPDNPEVKALLRKLD